MSSFIPRGARLIAESLQSGLSTNQVRIEPSGSSTANNGAVVTLQFPEGIVDLDSFHMIADVLTTSKGTLHGRIPPDCMGLIGRVEVYIGGASVSHAHQEYGTSAKIMKMFSSSLDQDQSSDRLLSNAVMSVWNNGYEHRTCVFRRFIGGFLGKDQQSVRYLDTSLLPGPIVVRITLAGPEVLTVTQTGKNFPEALNNAVDGQPTFMLQDIRAHLQVVTMPDLYTQLLRERLMSTGSISIFFKSFYAWTSGKTNASASSVKFQLSSESVDGLYAVIRSGTYDSEKNPGAALDASATLLQSINVNGYYQFKTMDSETNRDGSLRWGYQVLNTPIPQHRATVTNAMLNSVDLHPDGVSVATSRESFAQAHGIFPIALNLPGEGITSRTGLSTSGTSANFSFDVSGVVPHTVHLGTAGSSNDYSIYVLAATTCELRILPGRQMALVM